MIHSKEMLYAEKTYTFTVITNPSNAVCKLSIPSLGITDRTIKSWSNLKKGTVVEYSITYSPYGTKSGSVTINADTTLTATGITNTSYSLDSDITTYGSPTITSTGIISGFTTTNRLRYETSNANQATWRMGIRFKCTRTTSTYQCLVGIGSNSSNQYGCRVLIDKDGYLYVTCYDGSLVKLTETTYTVAYSKVEKWFTLTVQKGLVSGGSFHYLQATLKDESAGTTTTIYNKQTIPLSTKTSWNNYQMVGCQVYLNGSTWSRRYPATYCHIDLKEFYLSASPCNIDNRVYSYSWETVITTS